MHTLSSANFSPSRLWGVIVATFINCSFSPNDSQLIAIVRAKLIKYEFIYLGMSTVHREWISLWTGAEHFSG